MKKAGIVVLIGILVLGIGFLFNVVTLHHAGSGWPIANGQDEVVRRSVTKCHGFDFALYDERPADGSALLLCIGSFSNK